METSGLVLIDTSAWIEALRKNGDSTVRDKVGDLMKDGRAAWCSMVQLELWNGARGAYEKRILHQFSRYIADLPIQKAVWELAFELARRTRLKGVTTPNADILIAACALHYKVGLEYVDKHFTPLMSLAGSRK